MVKLNRIEIVRIEHGRTGKWLAYELGKNPCTISKWCSNAVQPDLSTLNQVAQVSDVNMKDLLNDTDNQ